MRDKKIFDLPAKSLEENIDTTKGTDAKDIISCIKKAVGEEDILIFDTYGDGNCGPRAIIQGILLDGLLKNNTQAVCDFLTKLFTKQSPVLQSELKEYKQAWLKERIKYDHSDKNFKVQLCYLQKEGHILTHTQLDSVIKEYQAIDSVEKINNFIQKYIIPTDPNVDNTNILETQWDRDTFIFYLAACLRFDIIEHCKNHPHTMISDEKNEAEKSLSKIGENTELDKSYIFSYLAEEGIRFSFYAKYPDTLEVISFPEYFETLDFPIKEVRLEPEHPIIHCRVLGRGSGHFVTLVTGTDINPLKKRFNQSATEQNGSFARSVGPTQYVPDTQPQNVTIRREGPITTPKAVITEKEGMQVKDKNDNYTVRFQQQLLDSFKTKLDTSTTQNTSTNNKDQKQLKILTVQFNEAKSSTEQYQKKAQELVQRILHTKEGFNKLCDEMKILREECKDIKKSLAPIKYDELVSKEFKQDISTVEQQAENIIKTINDYEYSNAFVLYANKFNNLLQIKYDLHPPLKSQQPTFPDKCNAKAIGGHLAEQNNGYGFPIALTFAGMGSVGVLAIGFSLGIITSPVLIAAGFAIAGLIPVGWLMHWLINASPVEKSDAQESKKPFVSSSKAIIQRITAFFSPEKKASDPRDRSVESSLTPL